MCAFILRVKRSQFDLYVVGNTAFFVKLSGEDKIESVGLSKCPYYHYLTNNRHFLELADDGKTAGKDMV